LFEAGAHMPFARRPDTWLVLSGPIPVRKTPPTAAGAPGADDELSEFTCETPTQIIAAENSSPVILVPVPPPISRPVRADVATTPIQNISIDRRASIQQPAERAPERVRRVDVQKNPVWAQQSGTFGRFAASTPIRAFAFGAAGGVLAMWVASAPPAPTAVPIASHTFVSQAVLPIPTLPASRADSTAAAEPLRPVGTSGRQTAGLNQRVTPPRPASLRAAASRRISPAAYRGSLAFRSAPQGAKVFVNGTFVGSTPLVLENLPVGSRAVRFEADGYQRWSTSTQVVSDRQTGVSATLAPARP